MNGSLASCCYCLFLLLLLLVLGFGLHLRFVGAEKFRVAVSPADDFALGDVSWFLGGSGSLRGGSGSLRGGLFGAFGWSLRGSGAGGRAGAHTATGLGVRLIRRVHFTVYKIF